MPCCVPAAMTGDSSGTASSSGPGATTCSSKGQTSFLTICSESQVSTNKHYGVARRALCT